MSRADRQLGLPGLELPESTERAAEGVVRVTLDDTGAHRRADRDAHLTGLDRFGIPACDHELLAERREHLRALKARWNLGHETDGLPVVLEQIIGRVVLVIHVAPDAFVDERGFDRVRFLVDGVERGTRETRARALRYCRSCRRAPR